MTRITGVDVRARDVHVARAIVLPGGVPLLEAVDGTEDDLRFIRVEAFGAENVVALSPDAFFRQLLQAFPTGLASAFGAYTAVPRHST